ncbi:MAG: 2-oxoglutarate dehydrogenase complex dihydrolipoyllysine-residue succinyltransferase [Gammaproteobacteria bacterium]
MRIKIKAPTLPESIPDAIVASWHKQVGDVVRRDEKLVDIETEKVMMEVPAPQDGILAEVIKVDGSTVISDETIAILDTDGKAAGPATTESNSNGDAAQASVEKEAWNPPRKSASPIPSVSPAARHLLDAHKLDPAVVIGTGKDGRLTKQDVLAHMDAQTETQSTQAPATQSAQPPPTPGHRQTRREPMSRLRATIADRLVQAQHDAALLTTFNEINMQPVMDLRSEHQQSFQAQHGVKLGFMSFFVKAVTSALQRFPVLNASVEATDIVYHDYYDIGIAVSSPRGLVVPVLKDTDNMSFAEIEGAIADLGIRAKAATLTMDELTGGTFTITNGGVFGSLLSTPIVNPPQSGILAMHKIQERPVAENGEVCIRPIMYVALGYDHRIIDGSDAVQFLVAVKEALEDPARLLLEI